MQRFREKPGTNILVGAPPKPLSKKLVHHISAVICDIEEIREAHLPEVITVGSDDSAASVLFLVFSQASRISAVMESIAPELEKISRNQEQFEIWPISQSNTLLAAIRNANCVIGWRD